MVVELYVVPLSSQIVAKSEEENTTSAKFRENGRVSVVFKGKQKM